MSDQVERTINSSMPIGREWITRRPLLLRMVETVAVDPAEILSEDEIRELVWRAG